MIDGPFRGEDSMDAWLDRHHVDVIRTQATGLDGTAIGKYIHRAKFVNTLPSGHGIADMALAMDITGSPHMNFWHGFRRGTFGDICLKPDLETLTPDGNDPNLGHCIAEFAHVDGAPISLCPRTSLGNVTRMVESLGYSIKATFELEFHLFADSFANIRRGKYGHFENASSSNSIYSLRSAFHAKPFMDEVTRRLDYLQIEWEGWNDEAGVSQLELNLKPGNPVQVADNAVRAKQVIYEAAVDLGMAATFMPVPTARRVSGMHIHHSLSASGEPAFFDAGAEGHRSALLNNWLGGLMTTLPAAVSYLCPGINAYRRFADFGGPPVTCTWGAENKSAALRLTMQTPGSSRIEHRVGSADLNPYLALAVVLAGGLAGLKHNLQAPDEFTDLAWGLPQDGDDVVPRLPQSMSASADELAADSLLHEILGYDEVEYWLKTRRQEWLSFHSECKDPLSKQVTDWEYQRYFEVI
jgi:glutamine synthetase